MKTTTILLSALLFVAAAAPAQSVRIGTWNLEHFGFRREPRTDDDYGKIAKVIKEIGFDMLAVQEIGGPVPMQKLCDHLGYDWQFVLGSTGLFRDDPGRISVGFLWNNARLELVQAEELLHLPRRADDLPIFHRVPVTAVFRSREGGLDFRAITVHLKASRGTVNERKRVAEVTEVAKYVRTLLNDPKEDHDIVLLGDFNHTYGAPAYEALAGFGVVQYLRPEQLRPTIIHFDDPIDHIAYTNELAAEGLVVTSLKVHGRAATADRDAWRKSYSDHIPVSVDIVGTDGDPDASFAAVDERYRLWAGGRAAAAPTNASATRPTPIGAGMTVRVTTLDGKSYHGTLLEELDLWVQLDRADGGGRIAIPTAHVAEIHEARR